jgi:hypothetical protein
MEKEPIYQVDDMLNLNYFNFNVVHGRIYYQAKQKKMVIPQANVLKTFNKDICKKVKRS